MKNTNEKKVIVEDEMVMITLEEKQINEHDIDEMCQLFEDVLLGFGYRFKDGWGICYVPIKD